VEVEKELRRRRRRWRRDIVVEWRRPIRGGSGAAEAEEKAGWAGARWR
jgi:hypothetical protein